LTVANIANAIERTFDLDTEQVFDEQVFDLVGKKRYGDFFL
jgi:hypothetical protein